MHYNLKTDKPVALEYPIELEFSNVDLGRVFQRPINLSRDKREF